MTITFADRVAIVTGAGSGLGREYALGLAARGARVVVNDIGRNGETSEASRSVVDEIVRNGGSAFADPADVSDFDAVSRMVAATLDRWGRMDILVNNAGILRDKTFAKVSFAEFDLVMRVHLGGSVNCTKAVWEHMRSAGYGRVVFTTSTSGLYGNFGQSNYAAAKMGVVGLMNVLHLEGAKHGIRVNSIAPTAVTGLTDGLFPPEDIAALSPAAVAAGLLFLVSEDAPSKVILGAGAGAFAVSYIAETQGLYLGDEERTPETIRDRFAEIAERSDARSLDDAFAQFRHYMDLRAAATGSQ